jgi:putative flippase GtrA
MYAGLPKPLAYAIVILAQVTLNFSLVRRFVFSPEGDARVQFVQFVSAISAVRVLDWITYTVLVTYVGMSFILAQVLCVGVFAALKFLLSEKIFRRRRVAVVSEGSGNSP